MSETNIPPLNYRYRCYSPQIKSKQNQINSYHKQLCVIAFSPQQAVDLVDRYLMVRECDRSMLQCLGCAAMLIASKFEEIHPPAAEDFVYISDNTYTKSQVSKQSAQAILLAMKCHFDDWKASEAYAHSANTAILV